MADAKISELTELTGANVAATTDVLPIVDTSATETKKIKVSELLIGLGGPLVGSANAFTAVNSFDVGIVVGEESGVGIKVDPGSPTYGYADIIGAIQTRTSGGTVPAFAAYIGSLYQYSFGTAAGVTETHNEYHIPHDYVPATDMFIHCHWSTAASPTGSVN